MYDVSFKVHGFINTYLTSGHETNLKLMLFILLRESSDSFQSARVDSSSIITVTPRDFVFYY